MAPLVWLVTGCTSGFGEQFILSILARGDKAIATGRNAPRMKHLEKAGAAVLHLDVTEPHDVIDATIKEAIQIHGGIDVLVNNAGYTDLGYVEDNTYEQYLSIFHTNLFGALKVTHSLLPHFRQKRAGTFVFNSSYLAWYTFPGGSAYSGTKAAMGAMVQGLQIEVASFGIKCLVFEPGHFRTPIISKPAETFTSEIADYGELTAMLQGILASLDGKQPGDPKKAVEVVIDVVKGEGCAKGREMPFKLPLGRDCVKDIRAKCEGMLKVLDDWKDVIESTDFDDVKVEG